MPGGRDNSTVSEEPRGGWFSFLSLAREELRGPIVAAIVAAPALILLLLVTLLELRALPRWMVASPALAILGATFWGWVASYRRLLALEDYPLSKIASAQQGYVRLEGRAAAFPGKPLESPLTGLPCCWYSYKVVKRDDESASVTEKGTSDWSFMLNDGSGETVVDPVEAKLIPVRVWKWRAGNYFYTERLILPGDPIFVLGRFSTAVAMVTEHDVGFQVGQLLAEWKKDMPALIKRFDLNGDARFSEAQWELVRAQARRDVEGEIARNPPRPQSIVSNPGDERPFIISARNRQRLERDITIWAWIHLSCFLFGAVILAALVLQA